MPLHESFDLLQWLQEYESISQRRALAHELNNQMTPLSMQVSMLTQNLNRGELEKAEQRLEKLGSALSKLQDFVKIQFVKFSDLEEIPFDVDQEKLQTLLMALRRSLNLNPEWLDCTLPDGWLSQTIDLRTLTLFLFHGLSDLPAVGGDVVLSVIWQGQEAHQFSIRYQDVISAAEDGRTPNLPRFAKLLNSTTPNYRVSQDSQNPGEWTLTVDTR